MTRHRSHGRADPGFGRFVGKTALSIVLGFALIGAWAAFHSHINYVLAFAIAFIVVFFFKYVIRGLDELDFGDFS